MRFLWKASAIAATALLAVMMTGEAASAAQYNTIKGNCSNIGPGGRSGT